MFLGRPWRKKRKVPLLAVRATPPPQPMSHWRPPVHNVPGQERQYYEGCFRMHAAFCGCGDFINHLNSLASRIGSPGNGQPPRPDPPPRLRALPAPSSSSTPTDSRQAPWRGDGGGDDAPGGGAAAGGPDDGELGPEDVDELLELIDDAE